MVELSEKKIVIIVLSSQYCVIVEATKIGALLQLMGNSETLLYLSWQSSDQYFICDLQSINV